MLVPKVSRYWKCHWFLCEFAFVFGTFVVEIMGRKNESMIRNQEIRFLCIILVISDTIKDLQYVQLKITFDVDIWEMYTTYIHILCVHIFFLCVCLSVGMARAWNIFGPWSFCFLSDVCEFFFHFFTSFGAPGRWSPGLSYQSYDNPPLVCVIHTLYCDKRFNMNLRVRHFYRYGKYFLTAKLVGENEIFFDEIQNYSTFFI